MPGTILWNHNLNHPAFWRECDDCGERHGPYPTLSQAQSAYRCQPCEDKMRDAWRAAAGHITEASHDERRQER